MHSRVPRKSAGKTRCPGDRFPAVSPEEAHALTAAISAARERWLTETVGLLHARSVWLTGSLGRGQGDAFSDLDLIVVDGQIPLHDALLTLERADNGPATGGYVGAMYDLDPLALWVDWYLWPTDLPVPRDARLLRGQGMQGDLDLKQALDDAGRGTLETPPDPDVFALAMLPLAAKYVARRDPDTAAAMAAMLGAPSHLDPLDSLAAVLSRIQGHPTVRDRVCRYLQVVADLANS